jgi:hypothetical protein
MCRVEQTLLIIPSLSCYVVALTQEYMKQKSAVLRNPRNLFMITGCDSVCLRW